MGKITLKQYTVNEIVFNKILKDFSDYVRYTDNLKQYYTGYSDKWIIYYSKGSDGEYLIVLEYILFDYCGRDLEGTTSWKQVIVRKVDNQIEGIKQDVTGLYSWNFINKILRRIYV